MSEAGKGSAGAGKAPAERAEGTGIVIRDKRKIRKDAPIRPPAPAGAAKPETTREAEAVEVVEPTEVPPAGQATADEAATGGATADDAATGDVPPEAVDEATAEPVVEKVAAQEPRAAGDESPRDGATADGATADGAAADKTVADGTAGTAGDTVEAETADVGAPIGAELGALGAELAALRSELDERLRDLQRVTAEYANYRKRVDRDRALVGEQATGAVLATLLPILDDLDRAREHDDLVGPFGAVADQLVGALTKFGLAPFGEKGDPFDPMRHEAVAHQTSAEVTEPTCVDVMRRGYLLGSRLLRPALVAVADPE